MSFIINPFTGKMDNAGLDNVNISAPVNGQILEYNGATGTWENVIPGAAIAPVGFDKQVQFNDGGASFGASAEFTWDKVAKELTITGRFILNNDTINAITFDNSGILTHVDGTIKSLNQNLLNVNPSGATASGTSYRGIFSQVFSDVANAQDMSVGTNITSMFGIAEHRGTGHLNSLNGSQFITQNKSANTIDRTIGHFNQVQNVNAGTITDAFCQQNLLRNDGGGTITNAYGLLIQPVTNTGTITNYYGLYLADTLGTNKYGIFFASTGSGNQIQWANDVNAVKIYRSATVANALTIHGNFIPEVDNTYDLGTSLIRWKHVYIGPGTLHLGADGDEASLTYNSGIGKVTSTKPLDVPYVTITNTTDTTAGNIRWTGAAFEGYDGGSWIPFAMAGGGANIALSNLSGTAVNQSILPGLDNVISLGDLTKSWQKVFVGSNLYLLSSDGKNVKTDVEIYGDGSNVHFRYWDGFLWNDAPIEAGAVRANSKVMSNYYMNSGGVNSIRWNATTGIDSWLSLGNFSPETDSSYDLGRKSLQWNNSYTKQMFINNYQLLVDELTGYGGDQALVLYTSEDGITYHDGFLMLGKMRVNDRIKFLSGTYFTDLRGNPSATNSVVYTLPQSDGTNGQILKTNGSGQLGWVNNASVPAGLDTEIQFNLGGTSFGSSPIFTFDAGNILRTGTIYVNPNGASALDQEQLIIRGDTTSQTFPIMAVLKGSDGLPVLRVRENGDTETQIMSVNDFVNSFKTSFALNPSQTTTVNYILPNGDGSSGDVLSTDGSGNLSWTAAGGGGANVNLSNLSSTAINDDLIPDTDNAYDLGQGGGTPKMWKDGYFAGKLTVLGAIDPTNIIITTPDNGNVSSLVINQNDVTNNPAAMVINNIGTGNDISAAQWQISKSGQINTESGINMEGDITMGFAGDNKLVISNGNLGLVAGDDGIGNGGIAALVGGNATDTDLNGGNVYIYGGDKDGSGTDGNVILAYDFIAAGIKGRVGVGLTNPVGMMDITEGTTQAYFCDGTEAGNFKSGLLGVISATLADGVHAGVFQDGTNLVYMADGTNAITATGDIELTAIGNKLKIKEGSNASMGTITLSGGTNTVNTTLVTANSRIFLTIQDPNGGTPGAVYVSSRIASTSFDITSTSALDTSVVAWLIIEPA